MWGGFCLCENYFATNLSDHIKTISLAAGEIIKDQFLSLARLSYKIILPSTYKHSRLNKLPEVGDRKNKGTGER